MISSFFNKSKPIHILVVSAMLLLVFIVTKMYAIRQPFSFELLGLQSLYFLVLLASLFLLDFFASRNKLTKKNSYKILMFGLFVAVLPESLLNSKILFANFFILLALRRIISLRSQKEIKKKLFDATFWISVATLFYFWASLFIILVFAALLYYTLLNFKNLMIPFLAILCVAIITSSVIILMNDDFETLINNQMSYGFDFTKLNYPRIIIATTLLISYGMWGTFYFLRNLRRKSKSYRPSFIIIIISSLVALIIIIIAPNKTGSEFLFLFAPLAIIMTNYLEVVKEKWFKEVLIWALIVIPAFALLL